MIRRAITQWGSRLARCHAVLVHGACEDSSDQYAPGLLGAGIRLRLWNTDAAKAEGAASCKV